LQLKAENQEIPPSSFLIPPSFSSVPSQLNWEELNFDTSFKALETYFHRHSRSQMLLNAVIIVPTPQPRVNHYLHSEIKFIPDGAKTAQCTKDIFHLEAQLANPPRKHEWTSERRRNGKYMKDGGGQYIL
jgi:hypothetical protein